MFYIIDARRHIAATANMASGKGTEDVSEYIHTDLIYCDIENIHVMRSSFWSLVNINAPKDIMNMIAQGTGGNIAAGLGLGSSAIDSPILPSSNGGTGTVEDTWFLTNLENSGWIRHISQIISAGVTVAEKLHLTGRLVANLYIL
jgi:hypothetical protein